MPSINGVYHSLRIWEYRFVGPYWEPPTDREWKEVKDPKAYRELAQLSRAPSWDNRYRHSDLNMRLVKVQVL